MSNSSTGTANTKKRKKKRKGLFLHFLISIFSTMLVLLVAAAFLLYGPIQTFRNELITKALGTMSHQWIATFLYNQATISDVMNHNKTGDLNINTDEKQISGMGEKVKDNATELPDSPADGEKIIHGIGFLRIKGDGYAGWCVKIYDPSRLYMELAKNIGTSGERTSEMAKRKGAFIGINAGGFADIGGQGTGGLPTGNCIVDYQQITTCTQSHSEGFSYSASRTVHNTIALDKNNKLILGKYTNNQIKSAHFKDVMEFKPFLIVNGVKADITGNGGMGADPRTAIGQTKDGVIIFLIIDGRRVGCEGATLKDLQTLMTKYGAYNAANLDGGSSSTLAFEGKVVNRPSSKDGERYVPNAFLVNYN